MKFSDAKKAKPEVVVKDDLDAVKVPLLSHGVQYPQWCEDGCVMIRPMRVHECKFVADMTPKNFNENITRVLSSVLVNKSIDPWALTKGDRSYLFLWLRIQVTSNYAITLQCPNEKCQHRIEGYDLTQVPLVELTEDYDGEIELELPKSKQKVTMRLLTGADDRELDRLVAEGSHEWVTAYALSITSIDGERLNFDQVYRWAEAQDPEDFAYLREFHVFVFHGPDFASVPIKCPECGRVGKMVLPFRIEYYVPTLSFGGHFRDAMHDKYVQKRLLRDVVGIGESGDGHVSVPEE